jgi:5-methylcytosine-specific restriction endonuclease McrA
MPILPEEKTFLTQFLNLISNEIGEELLLNAFFEKWPPQQLLIRLQKKLKRVKKKKVRNALSRGLRREIIRVLDQDICCYCGKKIDLSEFQVDHVLADEKGGESLLYNLVTSCEDCNKKKGIKDYNIDLQEVENKRKELLLDAVSEAWETMEGRMAIRKLLKLAGRYNDG